MGVKKYNPTSPGRRGMSAVTNEGLSPNKPEKSLLDSQLLILARSIERKPQSIPIRRDALIQILYSHLHLSN